MAILVDKNTRLLVQGITGKQGRLHTLEMIKYGTKVVAGVTPGKGGMEVHGIKVYDFVEDAVREHPEINTSIVFVPAKFVFDAVIEAIDAGIKLIVIITEHIPVHVTLRMVNYAKYSETKIIGPNTPGIISPGEAKVGIMPGEYFKRGKIGLMSRSGTLTYEVSFVLMKNGFGTSTAVGIGGDQVVGLDYRDIYNMFAEDEGTEAVVLIGEIGGVKEEKFAEFYKNLSEKKRKPVVAYIAGKTAPPGKKMGHAGAIVFGEMGSYYSKTKSLEEAGIPVAHTISEIPILLSKIGL